MSQTYSKRAFVRHNKQKNLEECTKILVPVQTYMFIFQRTNSIWFEATYCWKSRKNVQTSYLLIRFVKWAKQISQSL